MLTTPTLSDEITIALRGLRSEDRKLIDSALAEKVFALVLEKRKRLRDKGLLIRYSLSELHIGTHGWRETRQKIFGAYWRLLVRLLDNRERRDGSKRRVA